VIVRDPVHGDIELTAEERELLDSPVVQRLRYIRQLGTAHLVYPGCTHTRFDHSLGTLHTAAKILAALEKKGHKVAADEARVIRMAALVHDVTHIPFGHTFEDERKVFPRHDTPERLRRFLLEGELGALLARFGVARRVYDMIASPSDWQAQVVSGTLDADLLDYLRRDSYFAGLSQRYDDRVFSYFCIENGQLAVDFAKRGLERYDARSEITHLLRMRYFLTERVYFHHAKVISGAMVSKALELATEFGVTEADLYGMGDETLLSFLEGSGSKECAELVRRVRARRLYKRAFAVTHQGTTEAVRDELVARFHADMHRRRELEGRIAERAGVPGFHVIVYCPAKSALKEATILARLPEGVRSLSEVPHLELDALKEQYARIWRFWVFGPEGMERAIGKAAEEVLGIENELK